MEKQLQEVQSAPKNAGDATHLQAEVAKLRVENTEALRFSLVCDSRSRGAIVMQHMFASCYESFSVYSTESLGHTHNTHNTFISKQRGCVVIEGEIVLLSRVGFHSELE